MFFEGIILDQCIVCRFLLFIDFLVSYSFNFIDLFK